MKKHNDNLPNSVKIIDKHLSLFFDVEDILVFHEKESEFIHSDIYIIKPNEERPFKLLLTCGMSALPMNVPKELEHLKYTEVMMLLPSDWDLSFENLTNENNYWVIRVLKQLSKYSHINNTWLGYGHTIPIEVTQSVNHKFKGVILLKSITISEKFTYIKTKNNQVHIYSIIPIYKEELEFKETKGSKELLQLFQKYDIEEIVDINRKNVCE